MRGVCGSIRVIWNIVGVPKRRFLGWRVNVDWLVILFLWAFWNLRDRLDFLCCQIWDFWFQMYRLLRWEVWFVIDNFSFPINRLRLLLTFWMIFTRAYFWHRAPLTSVPCADVPLPISWNLTLRHLESRFRIQQSPLTVQLPLSNLFYLSGVILK